MALVVRLSDADDLTDLVALMDEALDSMREQRGGRPLSLAIEDDGPSGERAQRAIDEDHSMMWTATWESLIVGYAVAHFDDRLRVVTVSEIYTTPDARDIGVGESLLETALEWAIAQGAASIEAHALPGARETKNLFERFGLTARLITVRRDL